MIIDQIKQRLSNGFHPLHSALVGWTRFKVPHRDFIAVTPRVVVVIDDKDISHTISPLHIISLGESTPKE